MDSWLLNLTRASLVGNALMAGTFFVFSVMVMPALRRLPPTDGLRAMQETNRVVNDKPLFGSVAAATIWTWDLTGCDHRRGRCRGVRLTSP